MNVVSYMWKLQEEKEMQSSSSPKDQHRGCHYTSKCAYESHHRPSGIILERAFGQVGICNRGSSQGVQSYTRDETDEGVSQEYNGK